MPKYSETDLAELKKLYNGLLSLNEDDAPADPETAIRRTTAMLVGHLMIENQIENETDPNRRASLQKMLDSPALLRQVQESPAFTIWYQQFDITALHRICTEPDGVQNAMDQLADIQEEVKDKGPQYISARIAGARSELWTRRAPLFTYRMETGRDPGRSNYDENGNPIHENPWDLTAGRSSLASASYGLMLNNGVPVEELFLPFKHFRAQQAAGREVCMRYYRASQEDKMWFADQFVAASDGVSKFLDTKMNSLAGKPISELLKPENAELGMYASFLTDPDQELEHLQDVFNEKYGAEYLTELANRQSYLQSFAGLGARLGQKLGDAKLSVGHKNAALREAFTYTAVYEYLSGCLAQDLEADPSKTSYVAGKGEEDHQLPSFMTAMISQEGSRIEKMMKNGDPWSNVEDLINGDMTREIGLEIKVNGSVLEGNMPEITFDESARNERMQSERDLEAAEEARASRAFIAEAEKAAKAALDEDFEALRGIVGSLMSDDENVKVANPRAAVSRCMASLFANKGLLNGICSTDDLRQVAALRNKIGDSENVAVIENSKAFADYLKTVDPETPLGIGKLSAILHGGSEVVEQEARILGNLHRSLQVRERISDPNIENEPPVLG